MRLARRIVLLLLLAAVAFGLAVAWKAYHVRADLQAAEADVDRLDAALRGDDLVARNQAAKDLTEHVSSAHDRTDGAVWGLLEHAPIYGDDAAAVSAISRSLNLLTDGAVQPLLLTVDSLDGLTGGGRIDVDKLKSVNEPVQTARLSAEAARKAVTGFDSDNFVGPVQSRFDKYVDRLDDLISGLASGERALKVLPEVLGGESPRDYLLVFQNNAEIRATGGIPGSWAQIHADDGRLQIVKQGSSRDFQGIDTVLPISEAEEQVYSELLGKFWQDATFTPDWPRASELLRLRWEEEFAPRSLDGVISLDPVAMSYLMASTGPIQIGDVTLDEGNLVDQLLSQAYIRLDDQQQDEFFAEVARSVFNAVTGDLAAPLELVKGLDRAAGERRFLVTLFDSSEQQELEGTGITGGLPEDDGTAPRVVVALNDATASKMSYYLRYEATVTATGCSDDAQTLSGSVMLSQTIDDKSASQLPQVVTGPGNIGIPLGSQLVVVRIYGPTAGTLSDVVVAGERVEVDAVQLAGRPVATVVVQLSDSTPVPVTWTMTSGPGQTDRGQVQVTPGIEPGSKDSWFGSAC